MEEENYYDLLEINGNASDDEIKKAYRRLALKWHPDKNPFNKHEAEIHFKKVSEAYEILSDREKKDIYDRYGKEGLLNPSQRESYQDFDLFGRSPRVPRFHFRDPNELFNDFFKNNTFDMLNRPLQGIFDFPNSFSRMNGIFSNFGNLSSFSNFNPNLDHNQEFYNPNLDVTSHSSSTKMINGKKYETIKIEERGIETILKKENGVLMSKTINGIPQNIEKIET